MKPNDIIIPTRPAFRTACTTPDRFYLTGKALEYEGTGAGSAYTSYIPGYSMPDSIASYARGVMPLPPNWGGKQLRVLAAWRPANGSAGNVSFAVGVRRIYDGGTISGVTYDVVNSKSDATSGNTDVTVVTEFATSDWAGGGTAPAVGKNEFLSIALNRRGNEGADDTYGYTIYLVSIELIAE